MMMDFRDNLQKCQEYIHALEDEQKKIQVFQRELPLCLELVTQAIVACKQQLSGTTTTLTTTTLTTECFNGHSECSEQTTSDGPILEEFIPIKRSHSSDDNNDHDDEGHDECHKPHINHDDSKMDQDDHNVSLDGDKPGKKSDWLRSVQLWNQTPDPPTPRQEHQPKRVQVVEVNKNGGGAFHPFQKEKSITSNVNGNESSKAVSMPAASACSSAEAAEPGSGGSGGSKKEEKGGQSSQRKQRRCWSPELHRRFLHALQQLGGSHVATPKQIREMMKVDGLTNDEVKSHLQKYRLHTRRPSANAHNNAATQQTPQFVVVGGIWVPPQEYAAVATSGDTTTIPASNNIYAPVATVGAPHALPQGSSVVAQRQQQKQSSHSRCNDRASTSDGVHSNSPATSSSSTHTMTSCHAY